MSGLSVLKMADSAGENPRPGRTPTSTNEDHVERVRAVIHGKRRLTVREVADEVGVSIGSCHQIFIKNFRCVASVQIRAAFVD
jgi:methylphosphotriester-DNA--protein-cysteine methyltransferase